MRRTQRRLNMSRNLGLEDYVSQLQNDPDELDALYRDLLVGVTSFFRDPAAFKLLEDEIIPAILEEMENGDEFRAWVAGCATGEEAYSLAILIHENIQRLNKDITVKVFATDVHSRSLPFTRICISGIVRPTIHFNRK